MEKYPHLTPSPENEPGCIFALLVVGLPLTAAGNEWYMVLIGVWSLLLALSGAAKYFEDFPGCAVALTLVVLALIVILTDSRLTATFAAVGLAMVGVGAVIDHFEKTKGQPTAPEAKPQLAPENEPLKADPFPPTESLKEIPADPKEPAPAGPKTSFTRREPAPQTAISLVNGPHERGCYGCLTLFLLFAWVGPFVAQTGFVKTHGGSHLMEAALLFLAAVGFGHWFLQWRRMPRPDPDMGELRFLDTLLAGLLAGFLFMPCMLAITMGFELGIRPFTQNAVLAVVAAAAVAGLFRMNNRHAEAANAAAAVVVFPAFLLLGLLPLFVVDPKTYPDEGNPTPLLALLVQIAVLALQLARARLIRRRKREAASPTAQFAESRKIVQ